MTVYLKLIATMIIWSGIFINIVPLSATLLAWILLGEPVGLSTCAGALFVISGVTRTNTPDRGHPCQVTLTQRAQRMSQRTCSV